MACTRDNAVVLQDYIDKIEKFDKKLSDLDILMKEIDDELHKRNTKIQKVKTSVQKNTLLDLDDSGFDILYVHKKLVEAERDRLMLKKDFEFLIKDRDDFDKKFEKLNETVQELTGGLNQVRMSLSKITEEKQEYTETQKKYSNIFWNIIIPIIVSFLIFVMSLTFKSCSSTIFKDLGGADNAGEEYIDIK